MTPRGPLPSFIADAMQVDGDAPEGSGIGGDGQPSLAEKAADAERSLLALEDAVSDVVELEAAHLQLPTSMLGPAPVRLADIVIEPPERYAPFFSRIGRFFDLSESSVIAALTRLRDPDEWRPTGVPGVSKIVIPAGRAVRSAEASLVRWEAGAEIVTRSRRGVERILVIDGGYVDGSGVAHRPGATRELAAGARHSFRVSSSKPCIVASVAFRPGFGAWLRRTVGGLFWRRGRASTVSPRTWRWKS